MREQQLTIRKFRDTDAQAVSDLVRAALLISCAKDYPPEPLGKFAASQTPDCMRERARTTHFYVAEEGGTAVGCGAVGQGEKNADVCSVYSFYVLPSHQGRGIGRAVMETLEQDEYFRQARIVTLHASRTALPFYRKMGFTFRDGNGNPDKDGLFSMEKTIPE